MSSRLNQDVVSKFLSRVNINPDVEEQVTTETKAVEKPPVKTVKVIEKKKSVTPKKVTKTKPKVEKEPEGKKVLRTYYISKSQYLGLVRKNLDSGKVNGDISLVVRVALEDYLADVLNGKPNNQRKESVNSIEPPQDEMLQKGFYLTQRLVDAIKTYAYFNKINDSDIVRSAISQYLKK